MKYGNWSTKIGGWVLDEVHDGRFRLDGGAMFGVVPKVIWEKLYPADERNRIDLALRCLLLRGHGRVVLIDTGIGTKWNEKYADMFDVDHSEADLLTSLERLGVKPEDVTDVLLTHLHFDHAGGNTRWGEDGEAVPAFPQATYRVPADNLAHAQRSDERDHFSYMPENWVPLREAGLLELFEAPGEDGVELLPGITALPSDGHTPGLVAYKVAGPEDTLVYCADLIPTAAHVRLNYVMGYDLCARTSMREKRRVLEQAASLDWLLYFEHDVEGPAARVEADGRGNFRVRERVS